MANPQGVFTYPGINGVLSASVTFGNGINPSVTRVSVPWTPSLFTSVQKYGVAAWYYGGQLIREFPYSTAADAEVTVGDSGTVVTFTILDRRWMWLEGGQITGEYNVNKGPDDNGNEEIIRKKNPRELAELCLQAMLESSYDVQALPVDDNPYVSWTIMPPAQALAELCDDFGCEVALLKDNSVKIVQKGNGQSLPRGNVGSGCRELSYEESYNPAELPSKLSVVSAPTEWQVDFRLTAVGFEKNSDEPKQINNLSYKFTKGWPSEAMFDVEISDKEERELAEEHIGKTWQINIDQPIREGVYIKSASLPNNELPDSLVPLTANEQILPLVSRQVATEGTGPSKKFKKAIVFGYFNKGLPIGKDPVSVGEADQGPQNFNDSWKYKGGFSIDEERGLVKFSERIEGWGDIPSNRTTLEVFESVRLWLRCTVNLYDIDTRQVQRYKKDIDIEPNSPMPPKFVMRDDVTLRYYRKAPTGGSIAGWTDNKAEVEQQLDYYLEQIAREYQSLPSASARYAGFVPRNTDGTIRQISYSISDSGEATSSAEYNREDPLLAVTYDEAKKKRKAALNRQKDDIEKRGEIRSPRLIHRLGEIAKELKAIQ